jgi:predicted secreted hydrolase
MSWQTINQILGLAMVDEKFAGRLLANPLEAVREFGFDLTDEEQATLLKVRAKDISELSQILVEKFGPGGSTN